MSGLISGGLLSGVEAMTEPRKTRGMSLHSRASVRNRMNTDEPAVVALLGALDWGSLDRGAGGADNDPTSPCDGAAH
jgi:hypothetical protein